VASSPRCEAASVRPRRPAASRSRSAPTVSAIRKNKAEDPLLQAYDIIEVPEAGIFSKQRIGPTLLGALSGGFSSAISSTGMYLPNKVIY